MTDSVRHALRVKFPPAQVPQNVFLVLADIKPRVKLLVPHVLLDHLQMKILAVDANNVHLTKFPSSEPAPAISVVPEQREIQTLWDLLADYVHQGSFLAMMGFATIVLLERFPLDRAPLNARYATVAMSPQIPLFLPNSPADCAFQDPSLLMEPNACNALLTNSQQIQAHANVTHVALVLK
jgi:hypothetical protein